MESSSLSPLSIVNSNNNEVMDHDFMERNKNVHAIPDESDDSELSRDDEDIDETLLQNASDQDSYSETNENPAVRPQASSSGKICFGSKERLQTLFLRSSFSLDRCLT
ncbi:hypothetical protein Btru_066605 [Bulinus truncatus]|nr:hypothetical protein Btru_066605 [Bulinus truncatus]